MNKLNKIITEQVDNVPNQSFDQFDQTFIKQIFEKDSSLIEQKYDFIKKYVFLEAEDEEELPPKQNIPQEQPQGPISPQTGQPMLDPQQNTENMGDPNMDPNNIQDPNGMDPNQQNNMGMGQDISNEPVETDIPEPKDFVQYIKLAKQIEFLEHQKDLYSKYGTTDKANKYIDRIDKLLDGLEILSDNINKYTKEEVFNITDEVDKFINIISKKKKGEK